MRIPLHLIVVPLCLTLSACQTLASDEDRPARIVNPDADSRAALQAAINEALGSDALLADDALTDSSLLTIERWPTGTMENPVPQGRMLDMPVLFQLVRNGDDCVLVRQSDGARYTLDNTDCQAE